MSIAWENLIIRLMHGLILQMNEEESRSKIDYGLHDGLFKISWMRVAGPVDRFWEFDEIFLRA